MFLSSLLSYAANTLIAFIQSKLALGDFTSILNPETRMPSFVKHKQDGEIWLSGFYANDIPHLIAAADAVGLRHIETRSKNEWQWIRLKK